MEARASNLGKLVCRKDFPGGSDSKASAYNAGDLGSIPGLGISPGEGTGDISSILAWKIPWTEELVGYSLQESVGGVFGLEI